ncbi:MAG: hypothetical protein CXT71_01175 [Methanobacteriota archaeon]|nr:MAG: hypothetical protein CXT71_01175 [Euryarchaeota archaeon]HIG19529.1 MOSC domain-containing protein [Candidatus Poseidoniales archaeon]
MMEHIVGVVEGIFSGPMEGLPAGFSLPKQSVNFAKLTKIGIPGDSNLYRFKKKKGDPDMAILLLTTAELDELNALGFSLQPGDLGENILLKDIDFNHLKPDMILNVGSEVILQVSRICEPCRTLSQLPAIGKKNIKELLRRSRGLRGWYARVLQEGNIETGVNVSLLEA